MRRLKDTIFIILLCLLASSCDKFGGPVFTGRLYVVGRDGLYEISSSQESRKANVRYIENTSTMYQVTVSHDQRSLIYAAPDGLYRYDLDTDEAARLVSVDSPIECIELSQDSRMISYVYDHALYIYDLADRKKTLLLTAPSAEYNQSPQLAQLGVGGTTHYGQLTCGFWQGSDRLIFRRFAGPFPASIESGWELTPNTTTAASLEGEISLNDLTDSIVISDISADGDYILVYRDGNAYIAESLTDLENLKGPIEDPLDGYSFKFAPTGHELYYVTFSGQIRFIDPETLTRRDGPKLDPDWSRWVDERNPTWMGNIEQNMIFMAEPNKRTADIFLLDLNTSRRTLVANLPRDNNAVPIVTFVEWLPSE